MRFGKEPAGADVGDSVIRDGYPETWLTVEETEDCDHGGAPHEPHDRYIVSGDEGPERLCSMYATPRLWFSKWRKGA